MRLSNHMQRRFAAAFLMSLPFLLAACGGDDDSGSGSESAPGVAVDGPPLRYMPAVEEMPGLFTVDEGNSFGLSSRALIL